MQCGTQQRSFVGGFAKPRVSVGHRAPTDKVITNVARVNPSWPVPQTKVRNKFEEARKTMRVVYDLGEWQKHRSPTRWFDLVKTIPTSVKLRAVIPAVNWVVGTATFVTLYTQLINSGVSPEWLPPLTPSAACTSFLQYTTVAMSLLLVFRTSSSYGRWDEACKMWNGLLLRSNDFMRMACTCIPANQPHAKAAIRRWLVALSKCLLLHFQPEYNLEEELRHVLSPAELSIIMSSQHKPVKAIHAISEIINSVPMSPAYQLMMSQNLTYFHDVLGGCERLLRAPIPVSYTRKTSRFLFLWLTALPFAIYSSCGPVTIPVAASVAAVVKAIEEIGVQIEEPFGVLPLQDICNRIDANTLATLKEDEEFNLYLADEGLSDSVVASEELIANSIAAFDVQRSGILRTSAVLSVAE